MSPGPCLRPEIEQRVYFAIDKRRRNKPIASPPKASSQQEVDRTMTQSWDKIPFTIERQNGRAPGTLIFRIGGAFTARDMSKALTPDATRQAFSLQALPNDPLPTRNILDLTAVPYMDSSGLGIVARHFALCQSHGVSLVVASATPRVRELFRITKMDTVIKLASSVDEADTQ